MNEAVTLLLAQASAPPSLGSVFALAIKGGIMMVPIGICSLLVVAIVVERSAVLRRGRVVPPAFTEDLKAAADLRGQAAADAARALCEGADHPAARVIAAGLAKLGHTPEVVEKHIAAAGEAEVYAMRTRVRALSIIAALAPLLGLTGTIFGMIRAFATVAESGDNLGRAELLAGGIYEAMITTAAGLLVAMPTIVLYHWLSGRIERLTRDLDALAVWFVERFVLEPGSKLHASRATSVGDLPAHEAPSHAPVGI